MRAVRVAADSAAISAARAGPRLPTPRWPRGHRSSHPADRHRACKPCWGHSVHGCRHRSRPCPAASRRSCARARHSIERRPAGSSGGFEARSNRVASCRQSTPSSGRRTAWVGSHRRLRFRPKGVGAGRSPAPLTSSPSRPMRWPSTSCSPLPAAPLRPAWRAHASNADKSARGRSYHHPNQRLALPNIRIHGLRADTSPTAQLICRLRNTRSGCGISAVKRPSGVVTAVRPCGLPLGLNG